MPSPMRLSEALVAAAERESVIQKRSVPKQIEFWAELGKAVEHLLDLSDIIAIIQGFKRLKVESLDSPSADPEEVFNLLETDRKSNQLSEKVTNSAIYYETSSIKPGLIDRVESISGKRQAGRFENGEFVVEA